MSEIVGLITARGGSKGIPRKNVAPVGGKPLIAWTIEAAKRSARLDRVLVSTDDAEIREIACAADANVPFLRPPDLARDDSPHIDVVLHALDWLAEHDGTTPEYVVLLQPTSPLRLAEDIDAAVALALQHDAEAVVSVVETHVHPVLTYSLLEDGTLKPFVHSPVPYPRRQDLPKAYHVNGAVYVNRARSLRDTRTFYPEGVLGHVMPEERSLQIDTAWELHLAGLILGSR